MQAMASSLLPDSEHTPAAPSAFGRLSALLTFRTVTLVLLTCLGTVLLFAGQDGDLAEGNTPTRATPGSAGQTAAAIAMLPLPPGATSAPDQGAQADTARRINAGINLVANGRITAMPFLWAGSGVDRERATDCLAATGYYEAGTRTTDQRAVMQVVLNRVRHQAFPHSVCGVVFQGSERATGCQFTFTCDGSMLRRQPSPAHWQQARLTALEMLTGQTDATVGHATHYHTDWVHPSWSGQMNKIAAIDSHLFFRWRGNFGEPRSFTARYSGGEPLIARMAGLSIAHRGQTGALPEAQPAANLALTEPGQTAPASETAAIGAMTRPRSSLIPISEHLPDQAKAPDSDVLLVALDKSTADAFARQAEQACAGKPSCRFLGWTNPAHQASQFPISGRAIDMLSFSYVRQGPNDPGTARWNCQEIPRADQSQCLKRGRGTS